MSRGITAALALALAGLVAAAPARADDDVAAAKARFRRGVELYGERRYREAAAEFEAAWRLKPHGAIHFNVAQCRERLEEWPAALRSYQDYLRELPGAGDRAEVEARIRRIEARLEASGVQVLVVYSAPAGAAVSLDGRERGTTPLHAALPPGSHEVALALEGHERAVRRVELEPGRARIVEVELTATPATAPAPAPAATATPAAVPDLSVRPPARAPALAPSPPRPRRHLAAWVAGGTAVAAATAAVILGWSAGRDERALAALSQPDGAAARRYASSAESKARAANALYAVSGGAAVAAAAVLVLERRF